MNPFTWLAGVVGLQRVPRVVTLVVTASLLSSGIVSGIIISEQGTTWAAGIQDRIQAVQGAADRDGDGLTDALENRIGSDPTNPSTLGGEVLDGWLYHWYQESLQWDNPDFLRTRVLVPEEEDLPPPLRDPGAVLPPTVEEIYLIERTWRSGGGGSSWWTSGPAVDPRQWDNSGDGIADAWLVQYGLDPLAVKPDGPAPGDPSMTLEEKYLGGLDPTTVDSDGDGLPDSAELTGAVRFGPIERTFPPSDPTTFSSRDDGVADGFLVRFGLDPTDPLVADASPAGDGVTVREAFNITWDHCRGADVTCGLGQRLVEGPLLDPTAWDSLGDGVPDAWSIHDPHGNAHPLENATTTVAYTTEGWDAVPWNRDPETLQGVVVDSVNPAPAGPHVLKFADLYRQQRPAGWDEAHQGPWWGGLPTAIDTAAGGLPPAVATRGWNVSIDIEMGRPPDQHSDPERLQVGSTSANPTSDDTDGDGLTDVQEYFGVVGSVPSGRTAADDPDTDGDGLTDCQEVLHTIVHECEDPEYHGPYDGGTGTDPLRRDTSGSFLGDGQEYTYWSLRMDRVLAGVEAPPAGASAVSLGPFGDLDGDGIPNLLDRDSDGDGLTDGAELYPNRFLPQASGNVRPVTDPASSDTDGDGLPDWWEVEQSRDRVYGCELPCTLPDGVRLVDFWPIHPALRLSVEPTEGGADLPQGLTDKDLNLAGDSVGKRDFSNGLAFKYGLDPYRKDTTSADGIPDMFSIHWGVENIPGFVEAKDLQWTREKAERLGEDMGRRGFGLAQNQKHVVIDPAMADDPSDVDAVTSEADLLSVFTGREKGTWAYVELTDGQECLDALETRTTELPENGLRGENDVPADPSDPTQLLAARVGTKFNAAPGFCWNWVPYPLQMDIDRQTNPWHHDTDGDGLPDAWEAHYSIGGVPPSSKIVAAGCKSGVVNGVSGDYCLSYLQAYQEGIDPGAEDGDTDGGGLPDWMEVAIGLNPLDPADDHGGEDWDGDGLSNAVESKLGTDPLLPDTDRDGLLDGGDLSVLPDDLRPDDNDLDFLEAGRGNGDLCLPDPTHPQFDGSFGGRSYPRMGNRPGGPLTYEEIFDLYVDTGVLHTRDHGGNCPSGQVLFLRESLMPPTKRDVAVGAAGGGAETMSDSRSPDTSGDGVSDGWLVYWRQSTPDATVRSRLLPGAPLPEDAENPRDFVPTREEYGGPGISFPGPRPPWTAPPDWVESRDGTWWGGLDPTSRESAGHHVWFKEGRRDFDEGKQPTSTDLDNDGIPDRYDPYPALDHDNIGIVAWDESRNRYVTDYAELWNALSERPGTSFLDVDGDLVPDFLDRVRVGIEAESVEETLTKGGGGVEVTGRVVVDESTAAKGKGVENVAVKAFLRDAAGHEALSGAGFTTDGGDFTIMVYADDTVGVGPCPQTGGFVAGKRCETGITLASSGLGLQAGSLALRLEVEANDPDQHPIFFEGEDSAEAYKDASESPFFIADGASPSSGTHAKYVAVNGDPPAPDTDRLQISHFADATFPASSNLLPDSFTLLATTEISITSVTSDVAREGGAIMGGDDLTVEGRFREVIGQSPLQGYDVSVTLIVDGDSTTAMPAATRDDGTFHAVFQDVPAGQASVTATVTLPQGSKGSHLEEPAHTSSPLVIGQDTKWEDIRLNPDSESTQDLPNHAEFVYPATDPVRVQAKLVNHRGVALDRIPVTARIVQEVAGNDDILLLGGSRVNFRTNGNGELDALLGTLPPGLQLDTIRLTLQQEKAASTDDREPLLIRLKPQYETRIVEMANVSSEVGRPALVTGLLERVDGVPVHDPDASFRATADSEDPLLFNGTLANGSFQFAFKRADPAVTAWNVEYIPGTGTQTLATNATVVTRHRIGTHIEADPYTVLEGDSSQLKGRILRDDDTPVKGTLVAFWNGTTMRTESGKEGWFTIALPERTRGVHPLLLEYNGTDLEKASQATVEITVQRSTHLTLTTVDIRYKDDGSRIPGRFVEGELRNATGGGLPQRLVHIRLDHEDVSIKVERFTDADGRFHLAAADFDPLRPGKWRVTAAYDGRTLDAAASAKAPLAIYHTLTLRFDRAPAEVRTGDSVVIQGVLGATDPGIFDPVRVTVLIGGGFVAQTVVVPGEPWDVRFPMPEIQPGTHAFRATGRTVQDGVTILTAETNVNVVTAIRIELLEASKSATGDREIHVVARGVTPGQDVEGVEVILLRSRDGVPAETYNVILGNQGTGTLRLAAGQVGSVSVLAVSDDTHRLEGAEGKVAVTAPAPHTPAWIYIVFAVSFATALAVGIAFTVWRGKRRRDLAEALAEAHRVLVDPNAPARKVIHDIYKQLLRILSEAGDSVRNDDTVRDIAERATRAFRLPWGPMRDMTHLFELARYSDRELSRSDRSTAIRCLHALAASLGVDVKVQRAGPSTATRSNHDG